MLLSLAAACIAPARADDLDRFIAQEQRVSELPAIVVGVMRDGALVEQKAVGLANVELGVRATTGNAFEIGSISKQFTAWAILMLHEEGKVALDAPVGRVLADLPEAWGAPTLHQLMTHTAGLPDLEDAFTYGVYRETPTDADFQRRLFALKIDFAPGTKWSYSNTGYWLLARVIEKVSGLPYADFMQQRVFTPLGMRSTRSALPALILPGRAAGYERKDGRLENRDAMQPSTARGLGDLVSTMADMAFWEREQLSPRLISSASAARARQPVKLDDGKEEPYGYGWDTSKLLPAATLSHSGQTAGFTAAYVRVPDRRLAAVVFVNQYGAAVMSIALRALGDVDATLQAPVPQPVDETDPARAARVRQLLDTAAAADTEWREEWFAAKYWRALAAALPQSAAFYRRLGPVMRITRVGNEDPGADANTVTYRVVYADVSRIVSLHFESDGRIDRRSNRNE